MKTLKKCLDEVSNKDLSESTKEAIASDAVQIKKEGLADGRDANLKAVQNAIDETGRELDSINLQVKYQIGEKPEVKDVDRSAIEARVKSAQEEFKMPPDPDPRTLPQTQAKVGESVDQAGISSGKMAHGTYETEVEGAENHTWLEMGQASTEEKQNAVDKIQSAVVDKLTEMNLPGTARVVGSKRHKSGSELYDALRKLFERSINPAESASHLLFDSGIVGATSVEGEKTNYSVFDTQFGLTENAAKEIAAIKDAGRQVYDWLREAGLPEVVLKQLDLQLASIISLEGKNIEKSKEEWGEEFVNLLGATTPTLDGLRALIEVSTQQERGQMKDTTYHEAFHVAMMWLVPESQRSTLLNRFQGNEEKAAVAYAKYVARRNLGKRVLQAMPREIKQVFDLMYKAMAAISSGLKAKGYATPRHFFDNIYMGRYMPEFRLQKGATAMAIGKQPQIITSIAGVQRYILLGKDAPQPGMEELDAMTAKEQIATFQHAMTTKRIPVRVNPFEADLDVQRVIIEKGKWGLSATSKRYLTWLEGMRGLSTLHPSSKTILTLELSTDCPKRDNACLYCYAELDRTGYKIGLGLTPLTPKAVVETPYRREILTMPKDLVTLMNKIGGLRMFSFGDYRPLLDFDNVTLILIDAEAKGLYVKAVTKQPEFVHIFGDNPNLRINISIDALPRSMSNAPSMKQALDLQAGRDNIKIRSVALTEVQGRKFAKNEDVGIVTLYHGPTGQKLVDIVKVQNKNLVKNLGIKKIRDELTTWEDMGHNTILFKKLAKEFPEKICCQSGSCGGSIAKCGFGLSAANEILDKTIIPETMTPETKAAIAPPNNKAFKSWFGKSKAVDEHDAPRTFYRGDFRADKLGKSFEVSEIKEGGSGGVYWTSDSEVASNYATGKPYYVDDAWDIREQTTVTAGGKTSLLRDAEENLSAKQKKAIKKMVLSYGENPDTYKYDFSGKDPFIGESTWDDSFGRNGRSYLDTAHALFMESGAMTEHGEFLGAMKEFDIFDDISYDNPYIARSGVSPVYLQVENPFVVSDVSDKVLNDIGGIVGKNDETLSGLRDTRKSGTPETVTAVTREFREALKELGYDGIQDIGGAITGSVGHDVFITFEPTQIKSIYNEGRWDGSNPDTRMNIKPSETPFYSKLLSVVKGDRKLLPAKHQSVRKWLERKNVKPAEMKWMGVDNFLEEQAELGVKDKDGKTLINRDELLQLIEEQTIFLEEKVLGEDEEDSQRERAVDVRDRIWHAELEVAWDNAVESFTDNYEINHIDSMADKSELPEEYRPGEFTGNAYYVWDRVTGEPVERGRTLAESHIAIFDEREDATQMIVDMAKESLEGTDAAELVDLDLLDERVDEELRESREEGDTEYQDYQVEGPSEDYREMLFHYDPVPVPWREMKTGSYNSPHFDDRGEGLLMHVRYNTREIDGDTTLFIEEIQSDWHQAGKRAGYETDEIKRYALVDGTGARVSSTMSYETREAAENALARQRAGDPDAKDWRTGEVTRPGTVPIAPFRDNWMELAFKRMLRHAAENGFDRVAWTSGIQQIERYRDALRRQVDEIAWEDRSGWLVYANNKPEGGSSDKMTFEKKEDAQAYLDETIEADDQKNYEIRARGLVSLSGNKDSKTVFKEIVPLEGDTVVQGRTTNLVGLVGKEMAVKISKSPALGKIKGDDLSIGGHGMKAFYDDRITGFAARYGAQWGAKVEKKTMDPGVKRSVHASDVGPSVNTLPITDSMRKDVVSKPQTLFKASKEHPPVFHEIWDMGKDTIWQRAKSAVESVKDAEAMKEKRNIAIQKTLDKRHFIKYKGAEKSYRQHSAATGMSSIFDAFFHDGLLEMDEDGTIVLQEGSQGFMPWLEENLGEDWEKFLIWVAAKRSKELDKEERELLMTDDKRAEVFKATKPENDAQWEKFADQLSAINKTFLDIAEKSGLINAKSREKWEQHYYIPFHRIFEDEKERAAFLSKPDKIDSQIRHLIGSELKMEHPLDSLTKTWMHLLGESMRNVAQKSAFDFFVDTESGLVEEMKGVDVVTKVDVNTGTVLHVAARGVDTENILSFLEGGKIRYFKVNDIHLFNAMSNLNSTQMGKVVKAILGKPKNWLTYGATFGVGFRVRNLIRDTLHVAMIEKTFMPFTDSWKGLLKVFKNDIAYQEMKASGFSFGGSYTRAGNPQAAAKYIKKKIGKKKRKDGKANIILDNVSDLFEWWSGVGEAFENAARVQLYSKLREEGSTIQEAGYRAKDLLDFSKSGQLGVVQFLVQTVPFLNARMQGLYKLGSTAFAEDKAVQKNFAIRAMMLAIASLGLWFINKDNEDYKELEDWEKWAYYHVFIGDHHVWIPKPFEVGAVASTMVESVADAAYGNEDAGYVWDATMNTLLQTFAIGPPQLFVPAIELYANKSLFTGRPTLSDAMKKLPAGERFEPWTPRVLQLAGRLGVSPKQAEQFMRSTLGAIATTIFITTDALLLPFFPVAPEKHFYQYPIANLFYENMTEPQKNVKYLTRFYEMGRDLNEIAQGITNMRQTGRKIESMEVFEKNRDKLRYRKSFLRTQKSISKINKKMKSIMVDPNMTAAQKDAAIDKWLRLRNQKVKIVYDKLNEVM